MNTKTLAVLAVGLAVSAAASQAAVSITLDLGQVSGGKIAFLGNSAFTIMNNTAGNAVVVTDSTGTGDAVGLYGNFSSGAYSFGAISSYSSGPDAFSGITTVQSASANVNSLFTIGDLFNGTLKGTATLARIQTTSYLTPTSGSTSGSLSGNVQFSLLGMVYIPGTGPISADLAQLAAAVDGNLVLTFQFNDSLAVQHNLSYFAGANKKSTSISGSVVSSVVPEPSTYLAGLGALALFGFTAIPKRKLVK